MPHLLASIVAIPLAAALAVRLAGPRQPAAARLMAVIATCLVLLLAIPLWFTYDPAGPPYQLLDDVGGSGPIIGADGLTVALVWAIGLVSLTAILASWPLIRESRPLGLSALMLLQAAAIGVSASLDARAFTVCWAIAMVPVAIKTGPRRAVAVALAAVSVAGLAVGVWAIHAAAASATGVSSFDLSRLQQVALPAERQNGPFLSLLVGFLSAVPVLMLEARSQTALRPLSVAVLALTVCGLARFNLAVLPTASRAMVPAIAALSLVALAAAAVETWRAPDWRRALIWTAVGQLALVLLGLVAIDPASLGGSLLHPIATALAIGPLLAATLAVPGSPPAGRIGIWLLTLAAVGMPGLSGFAGAGAIVTGVGHAHPLWAVAAGTGLLALAGALVRRVAVEPPFGTDGGAVPAILLGSAVIALAIGLAPGPLRSRLQPTMARVITRLDPGYAPAFATVPGCGGPGSSAPAPSAPAGFTAIAPCDNAASPAK